MLFLPFCLCSSRQSNPSEQPPQCCGEQLPHVSAALRALSPSLQLINGSGRYIIKSSDNKTELRILKLNIEEDAGDYHCNASNAEGSGSATVNLRVRSRLAALWPFLGIVAEVLVLVTIIFIYEKRRKPDEVLDGKRCLGLNLSGETKSHVECRQNVPVRTRGSLHQMGVNLRAASQRTCQTRVTFPRPL